VPEAGIDRARRALAGLESYRSTLSSCGRFAGVVYLVPEPRDRFDRLIERLVVACPETPPFGGEFGSAPVPHLTAATSADDGQLCSAQLSLEAPFRDRPLVVMVDRVSVIEEGLGADGRWGVRAELSLGSTNPSVAPGERQPSRRRTQISSAGQRRAQSAGTNSS
jgi:hypothetical protein